MKNEKELHRPGDYEQALLTAANEFETMSKIYYKADKIILAEECEEKAALAKAMADRGPRGNLMLKLKSYRA